jgi:hypothetical protein
MGQLIGFYPMSSRTLLRGGGAERHKKLSLKYQVCGSSPEIPKNIYFTFDNRSGSSACFGINLDKRSNE